MTSLGHWQSGTLAWTLLSEPHALAHPWCTRFDVGAIKHAAGSKDSKMSNSAQSP
jgi:hypothetical protein